MKKILLLACFLQAAAGSLFAQYSVGTALPVQKGANTVPSQASNTDANVYYAYTASATQDELLEIRSEKPYTVTFSVDGTSGTKFKSVRSEGGRSNCVAVNKGQSVIIQLNAYKVSEFKFTFAAYAADNTAGYSCAEPIALSESAPAWLPTNGDLYMEYTATKSGTLTFIVAQSISNLSVKEGCGGAETKLSIGQDDWYNAKVNFAVTAGKTYILHGSTYSNAVAYCSLEQKDEGVSCEAPFMGKETGNVLPAAAGVYWYSYAPLKTGFVSIPKPETVAGDTVRVLKNCTTSTAYAQANDRLGIRFRVEANEPYLIKISKKNATAADETFDLVNAEPQAGDSRELPLEITASSHTTPALDGTYYYLLTAPATQSSFVKVACTQALPGGSQMQLLNYATGAILSTSSSLATTQAAPGEQFILKWTCSEGVNNIPFTVSFETIKEGDLITNPIAATLGGNKVYAGLDTRYYSYTATKSGFLKIMPSDANVLVDFYGTQDETTKLPTYRMAGTNNVRLEVYQGQTRYIKVSGVTVDCTFELSEVDYADGESCEMAFAVAEPIVIVPATVGHHFYVYTAEKEGLLTISSNNFPYVYNNDLICYSTIYVKQGTCTSGEMKDIHSTTGEEAIFKGVYHVKAGDTFIVDAFSVTQPEGAGISFELRDYLEGEDASTAIEIGEGMLTLKKASPTIPLWYVANLKPGLFTFTSENAKNYFVGALYSASDLATPLKASIYSPTADGTDGKYVIQHQIETASHYYIKLTQANEGDQVRVTGTFDNSGINALITPAAGLTLNGRTLRTASPATVYDLTGKCVGRTAAAGTLTMEQGIYVVKTAEGTSKVAVK